MTLPESTSDRSASGISSGPAGPTILAGVRQMFIEDRPGWHRCIMLLAWNLVVFGILSTMLLWRHRDDILRQPDMFHIFINTYKQLDYGTWFGLPMNTLVYGNIDFGVNGRLLPAFLASSLVPLEWVPTTAFAVMSLELFTAVYVACCLFGFAYRVAAIAAWITCFCLMPYYWPYAVWVELLVYVPPLATAASIFVLTTAAFYRVGKNTLTQDAVLGALLLGLASYTALALTQYVAVVVYVGCFSLAGCFIVSRSYREAAAKAAVIGIGAIVLTAAFGDYLTNYYRYNWGDVAFVSTRSVRGILTGLWAEVQAMFSGKAEALLQNFRILSVSVSHLDIVNWAGPIVPFGALAAALFSLIVFPRGKERPLFDLAVVFAATLFGFATWGWGYLEAAISPLYMIWFALGTMLVAGLAGGILGKVLPLPSGARPRPQFVMLIAILSVYGLAIGQHVRRNKHEAYRFAAIPPGVIFETLQNDIGLEKSVRFRGRLAVMTFSLPMTMSSDGRRDIINSLDPFDGQFAFIDRFGSNFRHTPLLHKIPTLFDVNRFVGLQTVAAVNYLATEPMDWKQVQSLSPTRMDPKWLAFFGVRYVVSTLPPESSGQNPAKIMNYGPPPQRTLYLYEVPAPNVGDYSPVVAWQASSARETLETLARPEFNPRRDVVVEEPVPNDLVSAAESHVDIDGSRLIVHATSPGRSLVVPLPEVRVLEP